jgi:hypothetical protein
MSAKNAFQLRFRAGLFAALCALLGWAGSTLEAGAQAVPVQVVMQPDGSWQLLRGGAPFFVKGAGGDGSLQALADAGGNAVRTWSTDRGRAVLDSAQAHGLVVMMGLWMGHERHGFNYSDAWARQDQLNRFRKVVRELRDHPALLMWGVGNEVDLFYSNLNVWSAVEDVAAMIHEEDPLHPTCVVTAGIDVAEVQILRAECPSVDLLGVNTYGGIDALRAQVRLYGWEKPYLVTEWGATGHWEVEKTAWGAPMEESSTLKTQRYADRYRTGIASDAGRCLGSFAFLWGQKQETTPTWYGVFLENGLPMGPVDALTEAWSGAPPAHRAPEIRRFTLNGASPNASLVVRPGDRCVAEVDCVDPDGDPITITWEFLPESVHTLAGGDREIRPETLTGIAGPTVDGRMNFRAPTVPGPYRLFLYATDTRGKAAAANFPFLVR